MARKCPGGGSGESSSGPSALSTALHRSFCAWGSPTGRRRPRAPRRRHTLAPVTAPAPPLPSAPTSHDAEERCKLRAWVEEQYTRVPLREKDSGTKLEALYSAHATASPPVHARLLGKTTFGEMLNAVYPHVGPYKNRARTVSGLYLLRK